jgi:hypothetical protein
MVERGRGEAVDERYTEDLRVPFAFASRIARSKSFAGCFNDKLVHKAKGRKKEKNPHLFLNVRLVIFKLLYHINMSCR